jgi:hypothetical protein
VLVYLPIHHLLRVELHPAASMVSTRGVGEIHMFAGVVAGSESRQCGASIDRHMQGEFVRCSKHTYLTFSPWAQLLPLRTNTAQCFTVFAAPDKAKQEALTQMLPPQWP